MLELTRPSGDPRVRIGGLTLALRLALDAQWAGATGVVLGAELAELAPLLVDPRLRIPVLGEAAPARLVRVPANVLVHRALFKALLARSDRVLDVTKPWPALDVPFAFEPHVVGDGATRRRAERALFRSLRKAQDGWTSRYFNRYISLAISRVLAKTPLSPNQLSVLISAVGLGGAALAAEGDPSSLVLGASLFQTQSVLDGCDGELSRVTYRGSLLGEWLDTIGDDLTNYGFFAGAGVGLFRATGNPLYLAAAVVTVVAGGIASAIEYRYLLRIGSGDLLKYPLSDPARPGTPSHRLAALKPLLKRDTFILITLLATLAGALGPILLLFALGALGILATVIAAERRMAKARAQS